MNVCSFHSVQGIKSAFERINFDAVSIGPLQSYFVSKCYSDKFYLNYRHIGLKPKFFHYREGGQEAIIPIIENRKDRVITEFAPLDYYNIICNGDSSFASRALKKLAQHYLGYRFSFHRVPEESILTNVLKSVERQPEQCVSIRLDRFSAAKTIFPPYPNTKGRISGRHSTRLKRAKRNANC